MKKQDIVQALKDSQNDYPADFVGDMEAKLATYGDDLSEQEAKEFVAYLDKVSDEKAAVGMVQTELAQIMDQYASTLESLDENAVNDSISAMYDGAKQLHAIAEPADK